MYKGLGAYGTLGMEIVVSFLLGMFGGKWLDDHYKTTPWFFLGGLALAVGLSISGIVRALRLMREVAAPNENDRPALYESSSERDAHRKRGEKLDADPVVERLPTDDESKS